MDYFHYSFGPCIVLLGILISSTLIHQMANTRNHNKSTGDNNGENN
jgi:hypothetical protein